MTQIGYHLFKTTQVRLEIVGALINLITVVSEHPLRICAYDANSFALEMIRL